MEASTNLTRRHLAGSLVLASDKFPVLRLLREESK